MILSKSSPVFSNIALPQRCPHPTHQPGWVRPQVQICLLWDVVPMWVYFSESLQCYLNPLHICTRWSSFQPWQWYIYTMIQLSKALTCPFGSFPYISSPELSLELHVKLYVFFSIFLIISPKLSGFLRLPFLASGYKAGASASCTGVPPAFCDWVTFGSKWPELLLL